ncbi:MAG TPA: Gfo/Idh/MocA family oxidoreductase, partial [Blastocatellia bacterium]|nr:Gfo/Idh/MocA family oxidoreductase [Blastocatellia bacterium]
MKNSHKTTRRSFLKLAAASGAAAGLPITIRGSEPVLQQESNTSPNDRIQIAVIGTGLQGMGDTSTALRVPGVELIAAVDLYDGRLVRAKEIWGEKIQTTRDYREVISRPDLDAVIIATPDHWHAQIATDAMNAGKDVYVEKPMVQSIKEGHPLIETARKTNRILQVGSQRVSSIIYHKAKELLASGAIGELNLVEAWWNRNSAIGAWQYSIPPDASPQTVDWDRFLGSAPKRGFDATRFFRWRNYRDYGTGVAGDLFVHLFSGMHLVVGANGPTRIFATGGLRLWDDGRDVPDVMMGLFDYPKTDRHPAFNLFLKVNFADGAGENSGFRFVGTEGVMEIGGGVTVTRRQTAKEPGFTIGTFPKHVQDQFLKEYRAKYPEDRKQIGQSTQQVYTAPRDYSDLYDHFASFFDAVRTRKPVIEDGAFGLRAAGPALVCNLSYFDNRPYGWNP